MSDLAASLSPDVIRSLGWALMHFVWQGAALAAALSVLMACSRRASTRYALGVGALVLMVAAPAITFLLLLPHGHAYAEWTRVAAPEAWAHAAVATASVVHAVPQRLVQSAGLLWLVEVWFAGVAFFALRTTGGFFLIERLRRRDLRPISSGLRERCQAMQRRLGIDGAVSFCETQLLAAPAVIGLFRPVVLLPVAALAGLSQQQLEAVIAHELAHIRRFDAFVNLFQVAAETLLFYHPAVWWVNRRIRVERENCCDDEAILASGNPVEYARALALMEEWRSVPILAMAANGSPVAARVLRLLGAGRITRGMQGAGFAASFVCLAGALIAGNTLWGVAKTSAGLTPPRQSAAAPQPGNTARPQPWNYQPIKADGATAMLVAQAGTSKAESRRQNTQGEDSSKAGQDSKEGFIEQMRAAGLKDLTVDQLIAMKTQGVTADYVRQMRDLGFNPNADELIAMRTQGVTPEYVRDMRAAGVTASAEQLVSMRVQGVSPEYVKAMKDLGVQPDADTLVGMRVQGVTPEYIRDMRAAGLKPSAEQLIGMRVQGVTPEYVRGMHDLGLQPDADTLVGMRVQGVTPEYIREMRAADLKPSAEQLIGMRVQGVTPEYVRGMHELGLQPDADTLVGMRVQGVTPEYIKDMRATGLKLTAEESIAMRVQGVTPEYVKALQAAGLQDLKADDYLAARVQGITPEFIEKARQHGFQNLTLNKLIQLKHAGVL